MTDREHALYTASLKGLMVIKPTRASPGVYGWDPKTGRCAIDAKTWKQAREQLATGKVD